MGIKIIKPGMYCSLQDRGRYGHRRYGVPVSGSMDQYAATVANLLTGNSRNEAVLEITLHGLQVIFTEDSLVAFCGGGSKPYCGNLALGMNKAIWIPKNSAIDFRYSNDGCRLYMGIAGGWTMTPVMGSRSFYVQAGAGRVLKPNDVLYGGLPSRRAVKMVEQLDTSVISMASWGYGETAFPTGVGAIRVTRGQEWPMFTEASKENWKRSCYLVTQSSNRMGYRLSGGPLLLTQQKEMISTAVSMGTVQVTPDGNPLILMADAQTTGGYPRIAQVIEADFSLCAQKRPGDKITFSEVLPHMAEALYIEREEQLARIEKTIMAKMGV